MVLAPGLPDRERDITKQQEKQHQPVGKPERTVKAETEQQHRHRDHERHFLADQLPVHEQRRNDGRNAQYEQYVQDVAADHVAQRQIDLTGRDRLQADGQLRRAGAERHHGKTDDKRRYAKGLGQPRGTADQHFPPHHQQHEA